MQGQLCKNYAKWQTNQSRIWRENDYWRHRWNFPVRHPQCFWNSSMLHWRTQKSPLSEVAVSNPFGDERWASGTRSPLRSFQAIGQISNLSTAAKKVPCCPDFILLISGPVQSWFSALPGRQMVQKYSPGCATKYWYGFHYDIKLDVLSNWWHTSREMTKRQMKTRIELSYYYWVLFAQPCQERVFFGTKFQKWTMN